MIRHDVVPPSTSFATRSCRPTRCHAGSRRVLDVAVANGRAVSNGGLLATYDWMVTPAPAGDECMFAWWAPPIEVNCGPARIRCSGLMMNHPATDLFRDLVKASMNAESISGGDCAAGALPDGTAPAHSGVTEAGSGRRFSRAEMAPPATGRVTKESAVRELDRGRVPSQTRI